jgi:signal transduction histidine kinase
MPASVARGSRSRPVAATFDQPSQPIGGPSDPPLRLAEDAPETTSPLHQVERIVLGFAGDLELDETVHSAHRRALALMGSGRPGPDATGAAVVAFAAELVAAVAPALAHHDNRLRAMIDRLETTVKIPSCVLGREVLRAPQLLGLPATEAVDVQLALVLAFTRARAAALWAPGVNGKLTMLAGAGQVDAMPAESQELAGKMIRGERVCADLGGDLAVTTIRRWQNSAAVLVVSGKEVLSPERRLLLEAAEPYLTLALERQQVKSAVPSDGSGTTAPRDGAAILKDPATTAERRLMRLRFDLHDGPLQDVLMLAEDLKLFRNQLESTVSSDHRSHLLGRIEDLEARLVALDGDLRRISVSVQSPFLHQKSFEDALGAVVEGFSTRTGLEPAVRVHGDFTSLTDSQHITLLGLIREALSNVREHSHADHVTIVVSTEDGAVTASVTDDGRGFDPETMLVRAARNGHLGLVGMHERVRLLGGSTTITSAPRGPTMIAVTLPPAPVEAARRS